jgi:hypothetical protein
MTTTAADISTLIADLKDFHKRREAKDALGKIGNACEAPLIEVLQSPNSTLNQTWAAIRLLADMQSENAIKPLVEIMRDNENLMGETARALRMITGREIGEDLNEWEAALGMKISEDEDDFDLGKAKECMQLLRSAVGGLAEDLKWDSEGDYAYLVMPVGGRRQQILVAFEDPDEIDNAQVMIYTECGPAIEDAESIMSRRNVTLSYGQFQIEDDPDTGESKVVLRHFIPSQEFDESKAREVLPAIATDADVMENELTGTDRI